MPTKRIKLILPQAVFLNTAYQGIGKVITVSLGILTTIFLTRYLDVLGFGQFNLVFAYLTVAATIADFGIGTIFARELSKGKVGDDMVGAIFGLRIITSIVILALSILILPFFPYPEQVVRGIVIYSFGSFFLLLYTVISSMFQAKLQMEKHVIAQISGSFIAFVATLLFITLRFSFEWIIAAQVIGIITTFVVGLRMFGRKISFAFRSPLFATIIRNSWPFFFSSAIGILYWRVDIIILSFLKNPNKLPDVGIYAIAYKIFEVFIIFGTYFANALFPVFIKKLKDKDFSKILKESFTISFIAALLCVSLAIFLAKYIIIIVAGEKFLMAVVPLKILSFGFGLSFFINIYYNLIIARNKQAYMIPVDTVALVFNVLANIIFIPRFSYVACAVITVLTSCIILFGYILVSKRVGDST